MGADSLSSTQGMCSWSSLSSNWVANSSSGNPTTGLHHATSHGMAFIQKLLQNQSEWILSSGASGT